MSPPPGTATSSAELTDYRDSGQSSMFDAGLGRARQYLGITAARRAADLVNARRARPDLEIVHCTDAAGRRCTCQCCSSRSPLRPGLRVAVGTAAAAQRADVRPPDKRPSSPAGAPTSAPGRRSASRAPLRPRRRRRLRGLCRDRRDQGAGGPGRAAPRIVGPDRDRRESGSTIPAVDALPQATRRSETGGHRLDSGASNWLAALADHSRRLVSAGAPNECWRRRAFERPPAAWCRRAHRHLLDRLEDQRRSASLPGGLSMRDAGRRGWRRRHHRGARRRVQASPGPAAPMGLPVLPMTDDPSRRCWAAPAADAERHRRRGSAALSSAGNVLRPHRLLCSACACRRRSTPNAAAEHLKALLEADAPYRARVTFQPDLAVPAPGRQRLGRAELAPWLERAMDHASHDQFGAPLRLHRPGRHHPADEPAAEELPRAQMMVWWRARPEEQRGPQRIHRSGLRAMADRRGRAGHRRPPRSLAALCRLPGGPPFLPCLPTAASPSSVTPLARCCCRCCRWFCPAGKIATGLIIGQQRTMIRRPSTLRQRTDSSPPAGAAADRARGA